MHPSQARWDFAARRPPRLESKARTPPPAIAVPRPVKSKSSDLFVTGTDELLKVPDVKILASPILEGLKRHAKVWLVMVSGSPIIPTNAIFHIYIAIVPSLGQKLECFSLRQVLAQIVAIPPSASNGCSVCVLLQHRLRHKPRCLSSLQRPEKMQNCMEL